MHVRFLIRYFLLFVITYPNISKAQEVDSTRLKYDAFVLEKKLKAKDKFTYSQYAIALRYKDTLRLNNTQIDQIYLEIKNLKSIKNEYYRINKESLDTRSQESEKLIQLLTGTQYDLLLRLKNHSKAKMMAENDWKEIETRNLQNLFSESDAKNEMYEYYIVRESLYDKYRHDPITQSSVTRDHYNNNRPIIIKTLTKARRVSQNNTLGQQLNGN